MNTPERDPIEDERKKEKALEALSKFNFFLHLTAWLSGCAYILILGILISRWLPFTLIPIGIWTLGLTYHAYRAFFRNKEAASGAVSKFSRMSTRRFSKRSD